ncbi:S-adenosyl-L-methionine-dependent methyltransferase [Mycena polygramma]|nr:S-adenosyl-L-methionine-dependent methyltransferase [Mycena polygramma]
MASPNFYVLVPPRLSPRKRKPSLSRSPSPSGSASRATSPNPSPKKKTRGDKDVDVAASGLSNFCLHSSTSRLGSPTVSDFVGPTVYSGGDTNSDDSYSMSLDDESDSSVSAAEDFFRPEKAIHYVDETSLPKLLNETPGSGLPVRRLRDFTLFKREGLQLINAADLLGLDLSDGIYGASGKVAVFKQADDSESEGSEDSEDSEDENDESSFEYVQLLAIIDLSVHEVDEGEVDENIYIRTPSAWYILETCSPIYEPYWTSLWVRHRFAHMILTSALEGLQTTYEQFIESLTSQDANELLTESAFESDDVVAYIIQAVDTTIRSGAPINNVPLIQGFTDKPLPAREQKPKPQTVVAGAAEDSQIFLAPTIGRIVKKHLISPVSVVGAEYEEANATIASELNDVLEHHADPLSMRWRKDSGQKGYSGVEMDGVVYRIGDVVAVAPGDDNDHYRAKSERDAAEHCLNKFANNVWFIRIMRFFDHVREKENGKPRKMLHGQWFTHGSRTILQETAHAQELFLLDECDDIAVATIFQRCDVRFLDVVEGEYPESDEPDVEARNYFCRFSYDAEQHEFSDPEDCGEVGEDQLPTCPSCTRKAKARRYNKVRVNGDGLELHGRVYHVGDYVYVKPNALEKAGMCLFVARIVKINLSCTDVSSDLKPLQLKIRHYERHSEDSRQVFRKRHTNCVYAADLDGHCFVRHLNPNVAAEREEIESWIDSHHDHFYTYARETDDGSLEATVEADSCHECFERHCEELQAPQLLALRAGKIPVLELFSGAGGLSQGLNEGLFTTEWAVERSVPAAETFRLNHPKTKVLCIDINHLLPYAIDLRGGKVPSTALRSSDKHGTIVPDAMVPKPGNFGLLCGGPPCQSFSGANSHKREDDPRSALPFTMLSVAEIYEPNFFLLENVTGLIQHSITGQAGGGRVQKAMLKLIIRGLLALNYQVRFKVLQAGQYGSPQDRERVIFFGAKRQCKLPEFPIPTHAFFKPAKNYQLFIKNDYIPPAKRGRGPDDDHIFAPHASVTIRDAIGDLPAFDWINPHNIKAETAADVAERNQRIANGIRQFDASNAPVGFPNPVPYATPPKTRYQRAMRRANEPTVTNHVTDQGSAFVIEGSTSVPLRPDANHRDLPKDFFGPKSPSVLKLDSTACFGRLDWHGNFKTAVTIVQPRSRGSCVLHPKQKRPISVLEAKRAQGFPDDYILWSDKRKPTSQVKDYYRHIGNAVPVPLAAALGRSLEAAVVETWKQMPREASPAL